MLKWFTKKQVQKHMSAWMALTLLLGIAFQLIGAMPAKAANFEEAYVRYDRMEASTSDPGALVVIRPETTSTEAEVEVTFPAGFTVDASCTVSTSNLPDGVTALPSSGSLACAGSGQVFSITNVSDLTPGTSYGVNIVTGLDLHATPGSYEVNVKTLTSGPATIDESNVATRIISDDQIVLTATVPPTFNFTLSANSDSFTTDLDVSSVVSTSGVTATLVTNASNGWVAFMRSANTSLDSAITGDVIETSGTVNDGSDTTLSAGTEGYVLDVDLTTDSSDADSGTVTIDADYNGGDTSSGGTLSTVHQLIASADGPTDTDVVTLIARAAIDGLTKAADDYTDTLTVVGAGNF